MGRKYPTIAPGEPVDFNWRETDFVMQCCDCGLVHKVRFAVAGRMMRLRMVRLNRETGQCRRHRQITVIKEK